MNKAMEQIGIVFTWWVNQLLSILPEGRRHFFKRKQDINELSLLEEEATFNILSCEPGKKECTLVSSHKADDFLANNDPVQRIAVHSKDCLIFKLKLPVESKNNIHEALGYQLSRHIPFKPEAVFYGHRIIESPNSKHDLSVQAFAVPRYVFSAYPKAKKALETARDINFSPSENAMLIYPAHAEKSLSLNTLLSVFAFTLILFAVGYLHIANQRSTQYQLDQIIQEQNTKVAEIKIKSNEVAQLHKSYTTLRQIQKEKASIPHVLDTLSRVLEKDVWLDNFKLQEQKVILRGQGKQPSEIVHVLEQQSMFKHVELVSSTQSDSEIPQFVISALLTTHQAPGS